MRARQYAPSTGRFLTRDMWVGDAGTPLSFNRWSYVNGNPINYIDPSGNISCYSLPPEERIVCIDYKRLVKTGTRFLSQGRAWTSRDKDAVSDGVFWTAFAFVNLLNDMGYQEQSVSNVFVKIFGTVAFHASPTRVGYYCERYSLNPKGKICYGESENKITGPLIAHELGHVYNATISNNFPQVQTPYVKLDSLIMSQQGFNYVDSFGISHKLAEYREYDGEPQLWRSNLGEKYVFSSRRLVGEEFADMFVNWVYNGFTGPAGIVRNTWMTNRLQKDMSIIFGSPLNPQSPINSCNWNIR